MTPIMETQREKAGREIHTDKIGDLNYVPPKPTPERLEQIRKELRQMPNPRHSPPPPAEEDGTELRTDPAKMARLVATVLGHNPDKAEAEARAMQEAQHDPWTADLVKSLDSGNDKEVRRLLKENFIGKG